MVLGRRSARRRGMVAGAAIASSRAKKNAAMAAAQQSQAQPASSAPADDVEKLKQLAALRDQGILTDDEFTAKKKQILGI